CGGDDGDGGDAGAPAPGDPTVAEPTDAPTSAGGGAAELVKASAVPVGGGTIIAAEKVVVTQPVANQFKAFSAICTHQRCPLSTVDAGTINCNCHQSKFSIEDGSVKGGPAKTPLPAVDINVQGDSITLA
ncbi:MAG TPA: Rieske (2Fe-2S) protein, partial [Pilimelia sp.]|nr:Rieske (2Fe-2S) protein [Pilimelia sp.]